MSTKPAVVSLRTVAERVGLAACSVSAILNNTPAAKAIPQRTKDRVFRAVAELNYRPNLWAKSLRTKRTRLVAAIASDIGLGPVARVLAGVQSRLHRRGYLLVLGGWYYTAGGHNVSVQLQQRGIEGVVAIDATLPAELALPVASVDREHMTPMEPVAADMRAWLSELGESAAEAIVRQIENGSAPRRVNVVPRFPSAFYGLVSEANNLEPHERA